MADSLDKSKRVQVGVFQLKLQPYRLGIFRWRHRADVVTKNRPLQLYYRIGKKMMSVDFLPDQTPEYADAVELFSGNYVVGDVRAAYDVDHGGRFYMVELSEKESPRELNMIVDWNAKYLTR